MKLYITDERKEIIEKFLVEKQGKASVRRIDTYEELIQALAKAEKAIKADILPKKALANCTLDIYTGVADFPNAYKYVPQGTHCKIKYNKKGEPELIDVDRVNVNHCKEFEWCVTEGTRSYILRSMNIIKVGEEFV